MTPCGMEVTCINLMIINLGMEFKSFTSLHLHHSFKGGANVLAHILFISLRRMHGMPMCIFPSCKQQKKLGERENQWNTLSSFDWSYTNCHLHLGCDLFGEQWKQVMCCYVSQLLIIKNILIIILKKFEIFIFLCLHGFRLWRGAIEICRVAY